MLKLNEVILFGTGGMLDIAISELQKMNISVRYLCDNNQEIQGNYINNRKILKPEELADYELPILISSMYANDISKQLKELKIKKFYDFSYAFDYQRWHGHFDSNKINRSKYDINHVVDLLDDQRSKDVFLSLIKFRETSNPIYIKPASFFDYFHPQVKPMQKDNIIDGGAWYGDSSLDFNTKLSGNCKIYAFEPDTKNFEQLVNTINKENMHSSVQAVNKGLYDKKATLFFKKETKNDMQFQIQSEESDHKIEVTSIDQFVLDNKINSIEFIKMAIEGSEVMALKGAQKTIKKDQPRLAICIYHEFDDLWKIPLLVKKLNPNYKLYIGHHSQNLFDTVLYAI